MEPLTMSKISPLHKEKHIDNSGKQLHYFSCKKNSAVENVLDQLKEEIDNASEKICIASTSNINKSICENLLKAASKRVRIYGLFQDMKKCSESIAWFDAKNPALIRSNAKLENNFIIIDNKLAFFFINSLTDIESNKCFIMKNEHMQDLFYWFTYFFWNNGADGKEHLLGKIAPCKEAPFSIPVIAKEKLNTTDSIQQAFLPLRGFYPINTQFKSTIIEDQKENSTFEVFLSDRVKAPVYEDNQFWKIGNFIFEKGVFKAPTNVWEEKQGTLKDTPTTFIDFDNNRWEQITKLDSISKDVKLPLTVDRIEDMENTEPPSNELIPEPYALETVFKYTVNPPQKPKNAEKAKIYKDFERLDQDHKNQNIKRMLKELEDLLEKDVLKNAPGLKKKINETKSEIEKEKNIIFNQLSMSELEDYLSKWDQSKENNWVQILIDLKVGVSELIFNEKNKDEINENKETIKDKTNQIPKTDEKIKELEDKLVDYKPKKQDDNEKKQIQSKIQEIENEIEKNSHKESSEDKEEDNDSFDLEESQKELNRLKEELKDYYPKNSNKSEKRKIESDLLTENKNKQRLEADIKNLNEEIQKKEQQRFDFDEAQNRERSLKNAFAGLKKPSFILPEVGTLYETKDSFYLEITDYNDLEKANELKNRYIGKDYKVVAGA